MIGISTQVSLYPLGQQDLQGPIQSVLQVFEAHDLSYETGPMSTLVWGDSATVFRALHEAFEQAATYGSTVMQVTVSNACPLPSADAARSSED